VGKSAHAQRIDRLSPKIKRVLREQFVVSRDVDVLSGLDGMSA
jgi:hypothetical protein